jgi:O-succinylbenzoate synthase
MLKKGETAALGECVAAREPWYSEETIPSTRYVIKEFLAKLLFNNTFETPLQFIDSTRGIRGNNMAVASVEMALWDLMGKLSGKSVSQLLGGQKTEVQVGVSVGIQPSTSKLVEVVSSYIREGYRRIKIKIKPGYDVEPVRAIRRACPKIPLQVDANSAYSLEHANVFEQLDAFDLLLIEQPLAHDDIIDHSKLQKRLSTPLCLDESIHSPEDARKAIEIDACRIINIKPGRVRGLEKSRALHDLCMNMKIPVWCGGMLETGIGRAFNLALASLPGFTLPSDLSASKRYFNKDIVQKEFELTENGTLEVPQGSGIGIEVDEKTLDAHTVRRETLSPELYTTRKKA